MDKTQGLFCQLNQLLESAGAVADARRVDVHSIQ
jgi:hypothetical protein